MSFEHSSYRIHSKFHSVKPVIQLSNPVSFEFTVKVLEENDTAKGKT